MTLLLRTPFTTKETNDKPELFVGVLRVVRIVGVLVIYPIIAVLVCKVRDLLSTSRRGRLVLQVDFALFSDHSGTSKDVQIFFRGVFVLVVEEPVRLSAPSGGSSLDEAHVLFASRLRVAGRTVSHFLSLFVFSL